MERRIKMSELISIGWFFIGIFWAIAGKQLIEVAACFLVAGIFVGAAELKYIRRELEDWEEDV